MQLEGKVSSTADLSEWARLNLHGWHKHYRGQAMRAMRIKLASVLSLTALLTLVGCGGGGGGSSASTLMSTKPQVSFTSLTALPSNSRVVAPSLNMALTWDTSAPPVTAIALFSGLSAIEGEVVGEINSSGDISGFEATIDDTGVLPGADLFDFYLENDNDSPFDDLDPTGGDPGFYQESTDGNLTVAVAIAGQYLEYGLWAIDDTANSNDVLINVFTAGAETPAGSVPTDGIGSYTGGALGSYWSGTHTTPPLYTASNGGNVRIEDSTMYTISSDIAINVDFDAGNLELLISNVELETIADTEDGVPPGTLIDLGTDWDVDPISPMQALFTGAPGAQTFSAGADGNWRFPSTAIEGRFYGPSAENIGGIIANDPAISPDSEQVIMSFGASTP